jgi:hypothetical protein
MTPPFPMYDEVVLALLNAPETCQICGRVGKLDNNGYCVVCSDELSRDGT